MIYVLDRSEHQPHDDTWPNIHRIKAPRLKEHVSLHAPCHTGVRPRARITLHVSYSVPNHTPHKPKTVMTSAHLYKSELASPSSFTSLFTTLLTHPFSVNDVSVGVLTWLL